MECKGGGGVGGVSGSGGMVHNARTTAMPQPQHQQQQQPQPPTLPGIDRDAYFSQHREAASDLMGVMGVDGKLYRSDISAKPKRAR
mmetsp:Transcript_23873/g.43661  ORF Transcript_23873/g.43661 Transcript_23873/m.43661 type:complete len:86 (-) Transcript_23873:163-420(-)